jgi:S1-C subfamily serine protease
MKTFAGHVLTALATLALVFLFLGRPGGPLRRQSGPEKTNPQTVITPSAPAREALVPPPVELPPLPAEVLKRSDADEQINVHVYAAVNRSVVNITTESQGFSLFGEDNGGGSGSGFVIDREGHILTNYHVVEGAVGGRGLQVTLFDGSAHDGQIVGLDPTNDAAIVRIDVPSARLYPVGLGDSAGLLVGQKVLAVGNPFGLERTLTTGIISSLDRAMRAKNGRLIRGIIQTDAAINPGNSGGPLLNTRGEVIGITTAIISQVGQSAGIGFAVPINTIKRILKPLIENGRVIRADLGLRKVLVTDEGLQIRDLVEGGAAARAGLQGPQVHAERFGGFTRYWIDRDSADRIVAIDGKPVKSGDDLLAEVEARAPGDTVTLTVIRKGRTRQVKVVLGQSS